MRLTALYKNTLAQKVEANNIEFQAGMIDFIGMRNTTPEEDAVMRMLIQDKYKKSKLAIWVRKCPQCGTELSKMTGEKWYCMKCHWECMEEI